MFLKKTITIDLIRNFSSTYVKLCRTTEFRKCVKPSKLDGIFENVRKEIWNAYSLNKIHRNLNFFKLYNVQKHLYKNRLNYKRAPLWNVPQCENLPIYYNFRMINYNFGEGLTRFADHIQYAHKKLMRILLLVPLKYRIHILNGLQEVIRLVGFQ